MSLTSDNEGFPFKLLRWYAIHQRKLPWRNSRDPYNIWLSEIILQQTRVAQGLPYYQKFTENFPTVHDLAEASEEKVLRTWQGLGYYSRARNLHRCARIVSSSLNGNFPDSYEGLLKLPGIGPYTAAAIASFAFNHKHAVVDGNVYRVLARVFGVKNDISTGEGQRVFQSLASDLIPETDPSSYNQAIMEFGALHCTPLNPACESCPFQLECYARIHSSQKSLPVKSKKAPAKKRFLNYAVLRHQDMIWLNPRLEKDIWQGLYDFPRLETSMLLEEEDAMEKFSAVYELPANVTLQSVSKDYRHLLSHQHLFARFFLFDLPSNITFSDRSLRPFSPKKIADLPKPVLILRYLNDYIF